MSYAYIALVQLKKRKKLLPVLEKSNTVIKEHIEIHQQNLKQVVEHVPDEAVTRCIKQIYLVEKKSLKKLISLILDNDDAAIEMTPILIHKIITKYIHCAKLIALATPIANEMPEQEEDLEKLQFEALIEQLRAEKHEYADKYKATRDLLHKVCLNYKDKLEFNSERPLEKLSLEEIATVFGLAWTSPKTEYYQER
jgi:hypothetical protein